MGISSYHTYTAGAEHSDSLQFKSYGRPVYLYPFLTVFLIAAERKINLVSDVSRNLRGWAKMRRMK